MNSVNLIGRLTKDVELRKTSSNISVVSFTVAVNSPRKDANGNYLADFINCTAWNNTAEFMSKFLKKGSLVSVEGSLHSSKYDDNGKTVYKLDVMANSVQSLESKKKEENSAVNSDIKDVKIDVDTDALPFY